MSTRLILAGAAVVLVGVGAWALRPQGADVSSDPALSYWSGELTIRSVYPKDPGGDCVSSGLKIRTLHAYAEWREINSTAVTDQDGGVVGRIVRLEDDASGWRATALGQWVDLCEAGTWIDSDQGEASGDAILGLGAIYYSADLARDPLRDVLPDGTYTLQAPFLTAPLTTTITSPDGSQTFPAQMTWGYWIGRILLPGAGSPSEWFVDDLAQTVRMLDVQDWQANPWQDGERRTLEPGPSGFERMAGSYQRWIDDQVWHDVSWDLERVRSRTADDCAIIEVSEDLLYFANTHQHWLAEGSPIQTGPPVTRLPDSLSNARTLGYWLADHAHGGAGPDAPLPTLSPAMAPPEVELLDCRVSNEDELRSWLNDHRHLKNPDQAGLRMLRERLSGSLDSTVVSLADLVGVTGPPVTSF